jgi:hypothetical protein
VNRLGVSGQGIYRPRASRFVPAIRIVHPNHETLDRLHVSKGKIVTIINSAYAVNLALEGTTCRKLWWIFMV